MKKKVSEEDEKKIKPSYILGLVKVKSQSTKTGGVWSSLNIIETGRR
jgi:hypothetical protein